MKPVNEVLDPTLRSSKQPLSIILHSKVPSYTSQPKAIKTSSSDILQLVRCILNSSWLSKCGVSMITTPAINTPYQHVIKYQLLVAYRQFPLNQPALRPTLVPV